MSSHPANIIGGPCLISFKGSYFRSKGDVVLDPSIEDFGVENDLYGEVDRRAGNQELKLSFTPEGRFDDLDVLFPYLSMALGSPLCGVYLCGAVNTGANTIGIAATDLPAGQPISFDVTTGGTMPTGLTRSTLYYLSANAGGARTIHLTQAAGIAGTSPIDITGAGTGTLRFVTQEALVILGSDGTRVTLHNAVVTKMPNIDLASKLTLWNEVEFGCFAKAGVDRTTANSVLTEDTTSFSDPGFDPADIVTQAYSLTWNTWSALYTKSGLKIENAMEVSPMEDDANGSTMLRLNKLSFTAKAQPQGLDFAALRSALNIDGAGAIRGRSLAGSDLNIEGTGIYLRLYAAALSGGPAGWKTDLERVRELTWKSSRTFTAGVSNPLFYIGVAAPV